MITAKQLNHFEDSLVFCPGPSGLFPHSIKQAEFVLLLIQHDNHNMMRVTVALWFYVGIVGPATAVLLQMEAVIPEHLYEFRGTTQWQFPAHVAA